MELMVVAVALPALVLLARAVLTADSPHLCEAIITTTVVVRVTLLFPAG